MASGGSYRNGTTPKASSKAERPLSVNSNIKLSSAKSKPSPTSTTSSATHRRSSSGVLGRVRVAVRLRPRNAEELVEDADFADCVELQPELKRLKLRKNNWDSDTYEFDELLTEFASQKRVYEVVAKPVVESVLEGYNGTVMAYGQTGTGKTYTLGRLGEEDTAARGIMVRSMEDILADISPETDSVSVSYLQLYMETIQDLLDPANDNISIVEDPKTGDVSLPGATLVEVGDQHSFVELLRLGEAHRFAANTKLNTESSRSHAILMVHVRRSGKGRREREVTFPSENGNTSHLTKTLKPPIIRKSKLVVVDLAGSERIDKSGSEGHTLEEAKSINLSLSALGKCINALAENSAHVPVRDSKLTRLLRDSFGGIARTSLVVTIGPSPRHRGETASTIMFGQRAMKVENMVKLKEEFDYKSLARRLDIQLDKLIAEHERKQKGFEDEVERLRLEAKNRISDAERKCANVLEIERLKYQKEYMESIKKLEEEWAINQQKHGNSGTGAEPKAECLDLTEGPISSKEEISDVNKLLQNEINLRKAAEEEANNLKTQLARWKQSEAVGSAEILKLQKMLEDEARQKEELEGEIATLKNQLLQLSLEADETRMSLERDGFGKDYLGIDFFMNQVRHPQLKDSNGQKASIAKLFEQVGLQKILSLLESEDEDVQVHAVKVVANLAAEEANQERIVEAGGLASLLMLLKSSENEIIRRIASGAIANLAMNEINQELIMAQGGVSLLSMTAADAEDSQTLRMVAGAIANLCGNEVNASDMISGGALWELVRISRDCSREDIRTLAHRTLSSSPIFQAELQRLHIRC